MARYGPTSRRSHDLRADRGASAVEYALLVAAIAAVIAGILFTVGLQVKQNFDNTCQSIENAQGGPQNCP
jgi:pilus assembly protein Flp/PilA